MSSASHRLNHARLPRLALGYAGGVGYIGSGRHNAQPDYDV